jgi:hypothetical protein
MNERAQKEPLIFGFNFMDEMDGTRVSFCYIFPFSFCVRFSALFISPSCTAHLFIIVRVCAWLKSPGLMDGETAYRSVYVSRPISSIRTVFLSRHVTILARAAWLSWFCV